jgi:hypothetical protein
MLGVTTGFAIGFSAVAVHYASEASATSEDEAATLFAVLLIGGIAVGGVLLWRSRNVYRSPRSGRYSALKYGAMFLLIALMENARTQTMTAALLAAVMIVCAILMAFGFALVSCEEALRRRRELQSVES